MIFLAFVGAGLGFGLKVMGESAEKQQIPLAIAPQSGDPGKPALAPEPERAIVPPPTAKSARVSARVIASGTIAAPQLDGDIQRIPARPSLSPAASKPQPIAAADPSRWRIRLLHQPVAISAGEIEAGGYRLVLEDIAPTDPAMTCTSPSGKNWPCGLQARTAFRAYLRARSIRCKVPAQPSGQTVQTACSLAGEDVAAWLVTHGWARSAKGGAAPKGVGLFGPPPL